MSITRCLDSDELDRLLSAYFRAEVPAPWPSLRSPDTALAVSVRSEMPTKETRQPLLKSNIALATSVALLFGSCWYLSTGVRHEAVQPHFVAPLHGQEATDDVGLPNRIRQPAEPEVLPPLDLNDVE